jgi:hypothetical protein
VLSLAHGAEGDDEIELDGMLGGAIGGIGDRHACRVGGAAQVPRTRALADCPNGRGTLSLCHGDIVRLVGAARSATWC